MKKLAVILSITAIVSLVGFAISMAVYGTNNTELLAPCSIYFSDGETVINEDYEDGKTYSMEYGKDISSLEIDIASANFNIVCSDTDKTVVKYTAYDHTSFSSVYENGRLTMKQGKTVNIGFDLGGKSSLIEVALPAKTYDEAVFSMMSGNGNVKGLAVKKFTSSSMSGDCDYDVSAENITIDSMSGDLKLTDSTQGRARSVKLSGMSGNRSINLLADEWDISSASGDVSITGLGGKVTADTASGNLTLDYTEWGGDLHIECSSGNMRVYLPAGSAAELDFDTMSGDLIVYENGSHEKYTDDEQLHIGTGSSVHNADINTASGDLTIEIRQ